MSRTLHLSETLYLPFDAVTQKLAFLGRTGSGKTYAATKLAEEMLDVGAQVIALDPVGVWFGLRLAADGKAAGISIPVFGGLHGDVPLEPTGGKMVADLVVDRGISVVLDVSQFESDAAKARFARDFAERFFFRKKASPSAVHLFLEECQEFIPQNPGADEKLMLHAFTRLIKLGRNFGIGASLISQRPQEVNKKALNMSECLLAFQMTGPHERKTVREWIEEKGLDNDIVGELPKLKVGHAHVWSPSWLRISVEVAVAKKRTFNASSTPEVGKSAQARELAPIDLEKIRADMAATIERAAAEDPKALRARIAQLEREARDRKPAVAPEARVEVRTVQVSVVTEKDLEQLGALEAKLEDMARDVRAVGDRLNEKWMAVQNQTPVSTLGRPASSDSKVSPRTAPRPVQQRSAVSGNGQERSLKKGARRMLEVLAAFHGGVTPRQLGVLSGIVRGGTFSAYLSNLRMAGYIEERPNLVSATQAGMDAAGGARPSPSRDEVIAMHRRCLKAGAARMFDILVERYPKWIGRDVLSESSGIVEGGTFSAYLSNLRTRDLIDEQPGELRASEDLFG